MPYVEDQASPFVQSRKSGVLSKLDKAAKGNWAAGCKRKWVVIDKHYLSYSDDAVPGSSKKKRTIQLDLTLVEELRRTTCINAPFGAFDLAMKEHTYGSVMRVFTFAVEPPDPRELVSWLRLLSRIVPESAVAHDLLIAVKWPRQIVSFADSLSPSNASDDGSPSIPSPPTQVRLPGPTLKSPWSLPKLGAGIARSSIRAARKMSSFSSSSKHDIHKSGRTSNVKVASTSTSSQRVSELIDFEVKDFENADPALNPDLRETVVAGSDQHLMTTSELATKLPPDQPWTKLLRARNLHDMVARADTLVSTTASPAPTLVRSTPPVPKLALHLHSLSPGGSEEAGSLGEYSPSSPSEALAPQLDWLSRAMKLASSYRAGALQSDGESLLFQVRPAWHLPPFDLCHTISPSAYLRPRRIAPRHRRLRTTTCHHRPIYYSARR